MSSGRNRYTGGRRGNVVNSEDEEEMQETRNLAREAQRAHSRASLSTQYMYPPGTRRTPSVAPTAQSTVQTRRDPPRRPSIYSTPHLECWRCGKAGHKSKQCTESKALQSSSGPAVLATNYTDNRDARGSERNYRDRGLQVGRRGDDGRRSRSPGVPRRDDPVRGGGSKYRDLKCLECGIGGHKAYECPVPPCDSCHKRHVSTTCPYPPKNSATTSTHGRTTGVSSPAPTTQRTVVPTSATQQSRSAMVCTSCGLARHEAVNCKCPICLQRGHNSYECSQKTGDEYCYECKGRGHVRRNCKKRIEKMLQTPLA